MVKKNYLKKEGAAQSTIYVKFMNCVIEQDVPDIYVGSIEKFE